MVLTRPPDLILLPLALPLARALCPRPGHTPPASLPSTPHPTAPRDEALALARQQGLDLVQPPGGDRSDAPLVVIGSLKKLRLEARRGEEEAERQRRALARESVPKEVQFSTRISDNDMETKMRKVTELLAKGLR